MAADDLGQGPLQRPEVESASQHESGREVVDRRLGRQRAEVPEALLGATQRAAPVPAHPGNALAHDVGPGHGVEEGEDGVLLLADAAGELGCDRPPGGVEDEALTVTAEGDTELT